jgi:gluconokinase
VSNSVVFMGVAGCGKSSLAQAVASKVNLPLIEGDDFHPPTNQAKMRQGIALTDDDRAGWLDALAVQLSQNPAGIFLTCSALKQVYRDRLRAASPGLRFVFLSIERSAAHARVAARAAEHLFPPSLVDSQFAALESPEGESGVLKVQATAPIASLSAEVCQWIQKEVV